MRNLTGKALGALGALILLLSPAFAAQPPFQLQITRPVGVGKNQLPLQIGSGWPFILSVTAPRGTSIYRLDYDFTEFAVVVSDPDSCFDTIEDDPDLGCLSTGAQETYTRIWIDADEAGVNDVVGDATLQAALGNPAISGPPRFSGMAGDGSAYDYVLGPATGHTIIDGVGYGANDDWPGLVLLADAGVGIVLDPAFNRGANEQRRNLAGFLTWTSLELQDAKLRPGLAVGVTVPKGLFAPLLLADEAIGAADGSSGLIRYRVDGGPIRQAVMDKACADQLYPEIAYAQSTVVRAFLVAGPSPAILADRDMDGDVDSADAALAGLRVLSNEAAVEIRHWDQTGLSFGAVIARADFDGNGQSMACDERDVGPGKLKPPPF